jgi:hypothetical protein
MAASKEKNPSAPDPISCHEQVQRLRTYRSALFDEMITPQVAEFTRVVGMAQSNFDSASATLIAELNTDLLFSCLLDTARFKCADWRLKYFACAEKEGDQAIECLDLNILHGDVRSIAIFPLNINQGIKTYPTYLLLIQCILQALAPEEFEPLRKCRVERPNEACVPEKALCVVLCQSIYDLLEFRLTLARDDPVESAKQLIVVLWPPPIALDSVLQITRLMEAHLEPLSPWFTP